MEINGKTTYLCDYEDDYWRGVFQSEPVITQESQSCFDEYGTNAIQSHVSTFVATAHSSSQRKFVAFFTKVAGVEIYVSQNNKRTTLNLCTG